MPGLLGDSEVEAALAGDLSEWTREGDEIMRAVVADAFAAGIRLVDAVAVAADEADHHPDIDIRWTTVTFRLSTHSEGGLTELDLAMARRIDSLVDG